MKYHDINMHIKMLYLCIAQKKNVCNLFLKSGYFAELCNLDLIATHLFWC